MAADGPKPGFLGNLNKDQEAKLQKLWAVLLKAGETTLSNEPSSPSAEQNVSPTQPQRRQSLLGRTQSNVSETMPVANTPYQQNICLLYTSDAADEMD